MAEDYPANQPLPDYGDYSGTIDHGVYRTTVPAPRPDQITTFNSPRTDISMSFTMDNDQYIAWILWVRQWAYNWFNMPVVSGYTPNEITEVRLVRFTSDIQYTKLGHDWLSVTVAVELQPGQP